MRRLIRTIKILKNEYLICFYPFLKDPCKTCLKKPKCKGTKFDCHDAYKYQEIYQIFDNRWIMMSFRLFIHIAYLVLLLVLFEEIWLKFFSK
jgi:hypothetical protein